MDLVALQRKWRHLRRPTDHLIEGESGDFVIISTNGYNFPQDIVNTRTGERHIVKYYNAGRFPPYKKIFEVSKAMYDVPYAIIVWRDGKYYLRDGTYRVGERKDGRLETKYLYSPATAVDYALFLHRNHIKPELI